PLVPGPEHQGHQRTAARPQLRVRPARVRPPHAGVLRVRRGAEGRPMSAAYLVQFGKPGFVGRFRTTDAGPLVRGARVVVRGPRGTEFGTVLCEPAARFQNPAPDDGDILRPAVPEDDATADRLAAAGREVLASAEAAAADLLLAFVDVELTLDERERLVG